MEASRERMHLEPIWLLKAEGEEEGKEGSERQPLFLSMSTVSRHGPESHKPNYSFVNTRLKCSIQGWIARLSHGIEAVELTIKYNVFFPTSKPIACVLLRLNIKKNKYTHSEGSLVDNFSSGANEFYVIVTVNFALTETADLAAFQFKACSYRRQHQQSRQSRGLRASKQHRH